MNQNIWGPHLWFSLHSISFNYPINPNEDDKNNYYNFFDSLKNVIPCSICKKNYIRHLNEHPIKNNLDNRKKLVYWLIDMHNMVNVETGKKIFSYDKVIKKYEDVYKKKIDLNSDNNKEYDKQYDKQYDKEYDKIVYFIFIILFFLLIINIIFVKKAKNY